MSKKIIPIKSTAEKRAYQMFTEYKMSELPKLATNYLKYLSGLYGGCGEVCLTAFSHYAQAVEGLSCKDDLYIIDMKGIRWFEENYTKKPPEQVVNPFEG